MKRAGGVQMCVGVVVIAALCGSTRLAAADDYFRADRSVTFRIDRERSARNKIVIGSLLGSAAAFVAAGALFNFDSRSKSNQVSARGTHTGVVWTSDLEDTRKAGLRSRNLAIAGYSVGGALLIATAAVYVLTDPGTEVVKYRKNKPKPSPSGGTSYVAPVPGGAVVGSVWRFD